MYINIFLSVFFLLSTVCHFCYPVRSFRHCVLDYLMGSNLFLTAFGLINVCACVVLDITNCFLFTTKFFVH